MHLLVIYSGCVHREGTFGPHDRVPRRLTSTPDPQRVALGGNKCVWTSSSRECHERDPKRWAKADDAGCDAMTTPTTPPPIGGPAGPGSTSQVPSPPIPAPPPPPPPPQEATRTPAGSGPWYQRRAVLVSSAVAAGLGVVLILLGIVAFASAAKTNSDAQATEDQVAALESETAMLQQQLDASQAAAAAASAKETAISGHTADAKRAVRELHNTTHDTVGVYNSFSECEGLTNSETAFVACANSWLQRFQAAITTELNAVATTRTAIAALEEDLRA